MSRHEGNPSVPINFFSMNPVTYEDVATLLIRRDNLSEN